MNKVSIMLLASIIVLSGLTIVGVQNASAVTWVEGHISVDTTWTVADAPYVVSNDVYVDDGATLTIEPGVEIRFGGYFNISVDGNLSAIGTSDDEIRFTSNKLTPAPGDWNTIKLGGTKDSSLYMGHCSIEHGVHGVTIDSIGRGDVMRCEFMNNSESGVHVIGESNLLMRGNTMKFSNHGISTEGSRVSGFSLVNSEIANNTLYGVHVGAGDAYDITIYNSTITSNGDAGVYIRTGYGYNVYNITISNNTITSNGDDGVHVGANVAYNITISTNIITSNSGDGVYIDTIYNIYDLTISNSTITSNGDDGVHVGANVTYNITISNNIVTSNTGVGMRIEGHEQSATYGIYITSNIISTNNKGIVKTRSCKANITDNSIAYNVNHGVYLTDSTGNAAHFNDIYQNKYGMDVTGGATVDAERNYWGDSSGPYHESMNPWGLGNPVNGDGTDLDFIPPLTSPVGDVNERPVPHIAADKTTTGVDAEVRFDASGSTDDQMVVDYYFDYDDGTYTGWVTTSVVVHKYSSERTYNVTLKVRDEYGVESKDVDYINIGVGNYQAPIANFTHSPESPLVDETITFNASNSTDPDGTIISYTWDFDDGNTTTTTEEMITHSYASEGDYNVNLTVTDNEGVTDSVTKTITITPPLRGDVNSDGVVTSADAAIVLNLTVRGEYRTTADVSDDGKVSSLDALMILQMAIGGT